MTMTTRENDAKDAREEATGWTHIIRAEYLEMPGLSLTLRQAMRFWNLDELTCRLSLSELVADGFLILTPDGLYCRGCFDLARYARRGRRSLLHGTAP